MTKEEQIELSKNHLQEMRTAFAKGDWDGTTRALVAVNERGAARQLLTKVSSGQYKKPAHYEFLARAYLDLKKYKDAAAACERAEELRAPMLKEPG